MKASFLIIFTLNVILASAQKIHLRGSVIDGQTSAPIPDATIGIPYKNLFYPADDSGRFNIESDITKDDSISFSCVGYQTKKIKADEMRADVIIKLYPMINLLNEVRIGSNMRPPIILGSKNRFTGGSAGLNPGTEIAMFMEGSQNLRGTVRSVGFFLTNGHSVAKGGDATAPFRIKLYNVDTSGMPGEELTHDIIIASSPKNEAWFDVDLSPYHITNPANGFFVSFCLLDLEYYEIRDGYKFKEPAGNNVNFASPRLATHQLKQGECQSYVGVTSPFFGFEWRKGPFNDDYMIRAGISAE